MKTSMHSPRVISIFSQLRQPGLVVIMTFASLTFAQAASRFWTGAINGNFATGGNWLGNVAPVAGDDLVFQAGITQLLATNNFSQGSRW